MNPPKALVKVNLGSGPFTPAGWINVDGSWNAWFAKWPALRKILGKLRIIPKDLAETVWDKNILIHDVRKKLPFDKDSVDVVYSSHLLEHLYFSGAKSLIKECLRMLRVGGILRLVVPDVKSIILQYIEPKNSMDHEPKADILNKNLLLREESPSNKIFLYKYYTLLKDLHSHKWLYDAESLIFHMEAAGFSQVKECAFLESRIDDIHVIEKAERVLNGAGICVEGIKP